MEPKYVLVKARHTKAEGVFSYDAYQWQETKDGKGTYGDTGGVCPYGKTERTIQFVIQSDLSWRLISDQIYDCRFGIMHPGQFETHEIASDDVGNDMLEVALAAAFPQEYSERNRKLEHEAEEARKDEIARKRRLYEYGC